jgi:hypothetical protein
MGKIGKVFAFVMFPLSILIILEALSIFSLNIYFDKVFWGAILMIVLQLLTLLFLKIDHGNLGPMQLITAVVFSLVALLAIFSSSIQLSFSSQIPLILGVIMFVETIYALH